MSSKKLNPTPKQADRLAVQRERGNTLRDWWHSRTAAAEGARNALGWISRRRAAKQKAKKVAPADRRLTARSPLRQVPSTYRVPEPKVISHGETYRNPARAEKLARADRLRRELR